MAGLKKGDKAPGFILTDQPGDTVPKALAALGAA